MPARRPLFAVAALLLAVATAGLVAAAAPAAPAGTGSIRGVVSLPSSAPARRPAVSRPGGTSAADRQQDAIDRQTSVVYLDRMPPGMAGEFVERRARLDQRGERFVPHVVAIGVGGSVDFPNSDPFFHNVFSLSEAKSFDLGRYASGRSKTVRFDKPGIVRVFCDIHSHMSATVIVFNHPWFAIPDGEGRFELPDVPAGDLQLTAWHERLGDTTQRIRVEAGRATVANFTLPVPPQ